MTAFGGETEQADDDDEEASCFLDVYACWCVAAVTVPTVS